MAITGSALTDRRLRSHRLTAPAASVTEAAEHMLAVQSQEFWGGRWALASRVSGGPTIADVDALFDSGVLVRAWTMRGTLHIIPARDLAWVVAITGERQLRQAAARHRALGLDAAVFARCETAILGALNGGNRLTRAEIFDVLRGIGVDPTGQRGVHVIYALAVRGFLCQGPVVSRAGGPSREQSFVLVDDWVRGSSAPTGDPVAALFARFVAGHGPATAEDFAWWAGLPLTPARAAAAEAAPSLVECDEGVYVAPGLPDPDPDAPPVFALPPFEEYYISYADRDAVCAPEFRAPIGPGKNGMVRPILVADGQVVGSWLSSTALGRHADDPVPELLAPGAATDAAIGAALDRYRSFITG
ncbi:hypothetical protein LK09_18895 [Microbacterium mangrovi]|uniref:Winged helix DNA-binding domain-containing protein n=1 Tax=Microbacterium mangrovi TaxID=1348253 RepID=A0A0B2A1P1_9MICO|nr:winged helix DNA-binding domain-containing protein [Microbacterium mangrovi]KHK95466.1 hypothetical protein LK09_18895 [Microbacterium mangrovi]